MSLLDEMLHMSEQQILELLADQSLSSRDQVYCLVVLERHRLVTAASVPTLRRTLESEDRATRVASIDLLAQLGGEEELELIATALASTDSQTVGVAALAIRDSGDRALMGRFLPEMIRSLDHVGMRSMSRWMVVSAIAASRRPDAVPVLARCALEPSGQVRCYAAGGLYHIGTPECFAALEVAMAQLSFIKRRHARRALLGLKYIKPPLRVI